MNSCLYRCDVMHERLSPIRRRFDYRVFMWALDVDELDALAEKLWLMSRNRWNIFSFWDRDHIPRSGGQVKENVIAFLKEKGLTSEISKVVLVTHLRTMGYLFNPISFYFCFGPDGGPVCAVAEVGNTFGEMKPFLLGPSTLKENTFQGRQTKYFYVSPFLDHDLQFDFRLSVPGERLNEAVHTLKHDQPVLVAVMTGMRRQLTNARLLGYALRFPLMPLQVMFLIQWQALKLFLKRLPYHKKTSNPHLQRGTYHA